MNEIKNNIFQTAFNKRRLARVVEIAGPRYTPKLNVELPIALTFDGLGRSPAFFYRLKRSYGETRRNYINSTLKKGLEAAGPEYKELDQEIKKVLLFLGKVDRIGTKQIDFKTFEDDLSRSTEAIHKCIDALRKAGEEIKKKREIEKSKEEGRHFREEFNSEIHYLYKLYGDLRQFKEFCRSKEALSANNPNLLLTGIAGMGKTHLFCDVAQNRINNKLPTLIFLGEEFNNNDPWKVILKILGITSTPVAFLRALDRYAAKKKTRALIMIDAINEARTKVNWKSLKAIRRFRNIGLALSIRSGFERQLLTAKELDAFVQEEHRGFELKEWEAMARFFRAFNLPMPEVPVLRPEFQNPLFLMLFCKGVSKRLKGKNKEAFRGHEGTTYIFEQFVKDAADKIAKEFGLKAGKDHHGKYVIWDTVIEKFAERMALKSEIRDRISRRDAIEIIRSSYPGVDAEKMLQSLERNFLITRVPKYSKDYKPIGYEYRFPFQKFSDHLIVRYLLNSHLKDPIKSFRPGKKLGKIINKPWNRGLIEALSIQIPERLRGKDLVYLGSKEFRESQTAREAFMESIIWRKPGAFDTKNALAYINQYITRTKYSSDMLLEAFLSVATIPDHPFNAVFVHSHLMRFAMPKRDQWWLPFLHHHYGEDGSIDRLITWARDIGNKADFNDKSLELAGIMLSWFLTSSNRFLRDRTTKALVSLLKERITLLINVLKRFKDVNDPYVAERLYAVAYGCALLSSNKQDLAGLAQHVYDQVFANSNPPVHILLRDYARGVIETALYHKCKIKLEPQKIRPPYNSKWPASIPSEQKLKAKYYPEDFIKNKSQERGFLGIWFSVMSSGDFARYIIGTNSGHFEWTSRRLGRPRVLSKKELYDQFIKSLKPYQRKLWNKLHPSFHPSSILIFLEDKKGGITMQTKREKSEEEGIKKIQKEFLLSLTKEERKVYLKSVIPYETSPHTDEFRFDLTKAQRWIFDRVVHLGWRPKLHGEFDQMVGHNGRESRKSERIGKKYQWIAYHEFLARVADNFEFRKEAWSDEEGIYEGPGNCQFGI